MHDKKARKSKIHELDVEKEHIYSLKINAVGGFRVAIRVHKWKEWKNITHGIRYKFSYFRCEQKERIFQI